MSSTWGTAFRVTTFGESHGAGLGCVIDGCPPKVSLIFQRIQQELNRRRPGQSTLATPRKEVDEVEFLSGVLDGITLGSPIACLFRNGDADPTTYRAMKDVYRPSHADFSTDAKYGIRAWAGGGRASARETVARVAAGAVARQVLETLGSVEIVAWVDRLQELQASVEPTQVQPADVEKTEVRCPDLIVAAQMEARIREVRQRGDTVGGVIRCVARGIPAGLGEPVFDKLEADLAKAMLSLPAARGFEVGSGFAGTLLTGTQHNDAFVPEPEHGIATRTNQSGGIQGGISNGMPIEISVAFKPVATVFVDQETVDSSGKPTTLRAKGRHDPCVLPRAVPMVEAMMCLVLVDHWLRWRGQVCVPPRIPISR